MSIFLCWTLYFSQSWRLGSSVPGESSPPGFQIAATSLYPLMAKIERQREGEEEGKKVGKRRRTEERERRIWSLFLSF